MSTAPIETTHCIGHDAIERDLYQMVARNQLPHTLLFHGPQGVGKSTLAYRLARYLLSQHLPADALFAPQDLSIDIDSPVSRRMIAGSHGDLLLIEPEYSGQNQVPIIKIEAVRPVAEFFSKTAGEGMWRVVLIDGADALNPNAANALLKSIEEPPEHAMLILISHNKRRLLPTLLSRCRSVGFQPLDYQAFEQVVRTQAPDFPASQLPAYFQLTRGAPGQALALWADESLGCYALIASAFARYPDSDDATISANAKWVEKYAKTGGWISWCGMWAAWMRRVALRAEGLIDSPLCDGEFAAIDRMLAARGIREWLEVDADTNRLIHDALSLHLDRKQVIQSVFNRALALSNTLRWIS